MNFSISTRNCISNDKLVCSLCTDYGYCDGIIATGTSFIYGPQADIDNLNYQIGFYDDGSIDCSLISNLSCNLIYLFDAQAHPATVMNST